MRRTALLLWLSLLTGTLAAAEKSFRPGEVWPDNNGVHINSSSDNLCRSASLIHYDVQGEFHAKTHPLSVDPGPLSQAQAEPFRLIVMPDTQFNSESWPQRPRLPVSATGFGDLTRGDVLYILRPSLRTASRRGRGLKCPVRRNAP